MTDLHPDKLAELKIAFWASLTNANAGMKWLDYDSMEEMISAAWEGFEEPAANTIEALQAAVSALEIIKDIQNGVIGDQQARLDIVTEPAVSRVKRGQYNGLIEIMRVQLRVWEGSEPLECQAEYAEAFRGLSILQGALDRIIDALAGGTVSKTAFDGHAVCIDFETAEEAIALFEALFSTDEGANSNVRTT